MWGRSRATPTFPLSSYAGFYDRRVSPNLLTGLTAIDLVAATSTPSSIVSLVTITGTYPCWSLSRDSGRAMKVTPNQDEDASPILAARVLDRDVVELRRTNTSGPQLKESAGSRARRFDSLRRFWDRHVHMGVPHVACRDHLGKSRTLCGIPIPSMPPTTSSEG